MSLRAPEFLQGKLKNCFDWFSRWQERWVLPEDLVLPETIQKITDTMKNTTDEEYATYVNESFLSGVTHKEFIRLFLVHLHKFYKLNGTERHDEVEKALKDARALVQKANDALDMLEKNKELLQTELFKAGAYTEILFWPYLYPAPVVTE